MSTLSDVLLQSGPGSADILTTNTEASNTATMKEELCVYMMAHSIQLQAAATEIYTR